MCMFVLVVGLLKVVFYEVIAVLCNSVAVATMRPEGDSRAVARAQNLGAVIFRYRAARKEFKR